MLLGVLNGDLILRNTGLDSHSVVRDGRKGSDEGSQDMEETFLLYYVSVAQAPGFWEGTYNWDTEGHHVEGEGGNQHDDKDSPDKMSFGLQWNDEDRLTIVHWCQWCQLFGTRRRLAARSA